MTGEGAGMAAGLATGLAIAAIEREEAEDTARRKSRMGSDQVMLETKKGIDVIGKKIAAIYDNWYYNEEEKQIYRYSAGLFGFFPATLVTVLAAGGLVCYLIVVDMAICTMLWDESCHAAWFPLTFFSSAILCAGLGILAGFLFHPADEPVWYIRFSESKKGTRVLLKIYGSDGRRKLDEDEIADIREMM